MNSEKQLDAGQQERIRQLHVAEALQHIGESLLHPFREAVCISFDIGTLHVEINRTDPREHDTHEESMYWFDAKDPSADPPLNMNVCVTPDRGVAFIQFLFIGNCEVQIREHLGVIESLATKLGQHIQSLRAKVDTGDVAAQIRGVIEE